jgi:DNA polymerase-3 subunit gamma/tau
MTNRQVGDPKRARCAGRSAPVAPAREPLRLRVTRSPVRETIAPHANRSHPRAKRWPHARPWPAPAPHPPVRRHVVIAAIDADPGPTWSPSARLAAGEELAAHAGFVGYADGVLRLSLPPADDTCRLPAWSSAWPMHSPALGSAPQIRFERRRPPAKPAPAHARANAMRARSPPKRLPRRSRRAAPDARHGADVVPDSIRPFDEA